MGLLDMDRQAELAQMAKDAERSSHGLLNDSMIPTSLYGSLMQDPADKERMDRQMLESTLAMMPTAGITLKHGSPADFWEFLDKYKLTGEGANAYTSGHYLAEAHRVAMEYVRKLARSSDWKFTQKVTDKYKDQLKAIDKARAKLEGPKPGEKGFPKSVAEWEKRLGLWSIEDSKKWDNLAKERFRLETKMKQEGGTMIDPSGYLYTAKIKDDVYGKMLDWDKPLTQQKGLLDKIDPEGKIMRDVKERFRQPGANESEFFSKMRGQDLVKYLKGNPELARYVVEGYLKARGVPGIKYFDQESRPRYIHSLRKDVTPKKQTRNVVSYEPKDIEIIGRQRWDSNLGLLD